MPEIKAKLIQLGFEPTNIPGEQFQRDVAAELKRWDEVVEKAGINAEVTRLTASTPRTPD